MILIPIPLALALTNFYKEEQVQGGLAIFLE